MKNDLGDNHDALIFDMDGTLWDAVATYTKSWNDFFAASNIDKLFTDEDMFKYMGWEQHPYLAAVLPEFSVDERNNIYNEVINLQYSNIALHGGKLYRGVASGLLRLSQKYQLFIVSNCAEHTITHFLKWAKLEPFFKDTLAFGLSYTPKHQNIKQLIKKYQLNTPVYIGDTQGDLEASELVPLPFVYVSYGFGIAKSYHKKFDSFEDLTDHYLALALFN